LSKNNLADKNMKFKEIQKMSVSEAQHTLAATRTKLRELRFKTASGQLKDIREIREQRKIVARVLTNLKLTNQK